MVSTPPSPKSSSMRLRRGPILIFLQRQSPRLNTGERRGSEGGRMGVVDDAILEQITYLE